MAKIGPKKNYWFQIYPDCLKTDTKTDGKLAENNQKLVQKSAENGKIMILNQYLAKIGQKNENP